MDRAARQECVAQGCRSSQAVCKVLYLSFMGMCREDDSNMSARCLTLVHSIVEFFSGETMINEVDTERLKLAMEAIATHIDIYGKTLEGIKEGRIQAENPEELRRLLSLVTATQKEIDSIKSQFVRDLLDKGKTVEEAHREFLSQLIRIGYKTLRDLKELKIQMTPSPSEEILGMIKILETIESNTEDPREAIIAQKIKENLNNLIKEGLI